MPKCLGNIDVEVEEENEALQRVEEVKEGLQRVEVMDVLVDERPMMRYSVFADSGEIKGNSERRVLKCENKLNHFLKNSEVIE